MWTRKTWKAQLTRIGRATVVAAGLIFAAGGGKIALVLLSALDGMD